MLNDMIMIIFIIIFQTKYIRLDVYHYTVIAELKILKKIHNNSFILFIYRYIMLL